MNPPGAVPLLPDQSPRGTIPDRGPASSSGMRPPGSRQGGLDRLIQPSRRTKNGLVNAPSGRGAPPGRAAPAERLRRVPRRPVPPLDPPSGLVRAVSHAACRTGGPRGTGSTAGGQAEVSGRATEDGPWIVVPVRSLTGGKRRLAPVLEPHERAGLVRRMLVRTLEAATAAGPAVLVVSPDPAALALAREHGAAGLEEPQPIGLNHALALAAREVSRRGGEAMLVVSADLPDVEAGDLRAMLPPPASGGAGEALPPAPGAKDGAAKGPGAAGGTGPGERVVRVAPDEAGAGTNALYVRPPGLLAFAYGEGSCARHLEQALALGARAGRIERPGLRFDLDTPDDLARYERRRLGRPHAEGES